jgi:RIO kinase 1
MTLNTREHPIHSKPMHTNFETKTESTSDYFEDIDDNGQTESLVARGQRLSRSPARHPLKQIEPLRQFVKSQDDSINNLKFTYKAARFEEGWLLNSLVGFYEHGRISDVLKRVKGGKEASVYLCRGRDEVDAELVAAKVYRPRSLRNLKNDHAYREGRENLDSQGKVVIDDGMLHAMKKRTEYGKALLHQSWIAYEFNCLRSLKAAGADVPVPYEMADNAILMGYIGDLDGCAPTLSEITLERSEARVLFERVLRNIDILLTNECIHGDLSAYNILFWDGEITLIDFPQVISPRINRNAQRIFQRDVARVCEYFNKQGLKTDASRIASDLWRSHGYRTEPEVDIRLLDENEAYFGGQGKHKKTEKR